jgi:hypothetical protein
VAQAIVARRDGDAFQARLFWGRAARLLDPHGHVRRVGFESGPGGFDDIWVEYEPGHGPLDPEGVPLGRVHMQCKWHVSPGAYGHAALVDPEFINAKSRSLLQRARDAQIAHAPDGRGIRFQLTTNWGVDHRDALRPMIASRSSALVATRLFEGKTDRSQQGQVRKLWRDHLAIDDQELRRLAQTLAFGQVPDSLDALREQLDLVFRLVGLRSVPQAESGFVYDDVVFQWLAQGRLEFDRPSFEAACARENLIGPAAGGPKVYGVKSFEHPFDRLEERCDEVLSLVQHFDDRYIRGQSDWATVLYPELRTFLSAAAKETPQLRLALDAHVTLAFAAGSVLDIKSGRRVEIEQRTLERRIWSADDTDVDANWPHLSCDWTDVDPNGQDIAVAIGLTHDIEAAVRRQLASQTGLRGLLFCRPSCGPSARALACGAHASALAEAVVAEARARRTAGGRVHLFIAGPNAFTFFLGQRRAALGRVTLYEYDFEGARTGGYVPSLSLPL